MIVIIDYGVGNLFSLKNALDYLEIPALISKNPQEIKASSALILPGVGAYQDAMKSLEESNLIPLIKEEVKNGKPLLGICLGMQLLYERGLEYGEYPGLGLIKGEIIGMKENFKTTLKVPQMGWNKLVFKQDNPILKNISESDEVYFVHSYYVTSKGDEVVATVEYEVEIPALIIQDNLYGMQFHPEKSGQVGLSLLKSFSEVTK